MKATKAGEETEQMGRSNRGKKMVFATLQNLNIKHRRLRMVGVGGVETQHSDFYNSHFPKFFTA